uniref:Tc1-like transposase DDE domain-containing protein n=1 Tax=Plectus sambesii TaxID=2011161 RepID=A0A914VUX5_9BILA
MALQPLLSIMPQLLDLVSSRWRGGVTDEKEAVISRHQKELAEKLLSFPVILQQFRAQLLLNDKEVGEIQAQGFTTSPRTPASRGKRAIAVHCVSEDGLVDGAEMLFASNSTDEDGDYHCEMDANKFEAYLMRVAPALKHESEWLVVLILDNAPYHCHYANKKPTMATTRAAMKD